MFQFRQILATALFLILIGFLFSLQAQSPAGGERNASPY
jgi:hypothetical protein